VVQPSPLSVSCRPERPGDVDTIRQVTIDAFRDMPYADGTEHLIVDALRKQGELVVSVVAESGGELVGHAAASAVTVTDGAAGWFGLGPVSVTPAAQRRGVGSAVVRAVLERLRRQGASGCVVVGDPAYYARFGFATTPSMAFPDVPAEDFMVLTLRPPTPTGIVTFSSAFSLATDH
jgi:predicted N-acetyltransferase YhbS